MAPVRIFRQDNYLHDWFGQPIFGVSQHICAAPRFGPDDAGTTFVMLAHIDVIARSTAFATAIAIRDAKHNHSALQDLKRVDRVYTK